MVQCGSENGRDEKYEGWFYLANAMYDSRRNRTFHFKVPEQNLD